MRRKEIFSIRIIRVISSVLLRLTGITPVYIRAFLPWKCRYFFPRIPLVLMLKLESLLSRVIIARSKLHSIDRRSFDRILLERFTCHACLQFKQTLSEDISLSLSLSLSTFCSYRWRDPRRTFASTFAQRNQLSPPRYLRAGVSTFSGRDVLSRARILSTRRSACRRDICKGKSE